MKSHGVLHNKDLSVININCDAGVLNIMGKSFRKLGTVFDENPHQLRRKVLTFFM